MKFRTPVHGNANVPHPLHDRGQGDDFEMMVEEKDLKADIQCQAILV